MRSKGYSSWVCLSVCLSVCPCSNSLLDGLFVPQTIRRNKRVIRISSIERFSLKMLRCRDLSVTSIVRVHSAGHFFTRGKRACALYYDHVAVRKRKMFVCAVSYDFPWLSCLQARFAHCHNVKLVYIPLRLKLCKCCQHVFQSKRKAEYSLSDQATKRMRVSKATKRASETSEQTLHRQRGFAL